MVCFVPVLDLTAFAAERTYLYRISKVYKHASCDLPSINLFEIRGAPSGSSRGTEPIV
jgi:hypothetical protein